MPDYPVPFRGESDGRWHEDMDEDYRNAKDDDERPQILLSFGYDNAHEAEVYPPTAAMNHSILIPPNEREA